ncbi:protein spaetzle-like, partial [Limulus polyphemus]|uniref:Protein spaetzle-like n=1 Tax=Limulus polyphemus TaxID=6850 RepID=A0ABM1BRB3_LIMPO
TRRPVKRPPPSPVTRPTPITRPPRPPVIRPPLVTRRPIKRPPPSHFTRPTSTPVRRRPRPPISRPLPVTKVTERPFPLGPPQTVVRPDRPLPDFGMPPCALSGKNFCILTDDYPSNIMDKMTDEEMKTKLKIIYEELQTIGDPELFVNHLGNGPAAHGKFACESVPNVMRPGWVQDAVSGEWMIVVNSEFFPQMVRTESCKKPNEPCSFIAPFYESTCQQRFSLHRLIAFHPWDPGHSPVVALFKFPAGCSCRVVPKIQRK